MKKIYVTFIAIVAAFTAVSCSVGHALNPVKLYVADASPGVYGMGLSDIERIDLLHGGTDDRQAEPPQTATVTVSGKEYTGEYVANYDSPFYESGSYEYKCETDESTLIFRTDRKTGELVYYIIHANVKTTGPEKPYEECRDIADAALKQLGVSDTYAHEDYDEKPYVVMDDYHFVYCRTFDGVSTFDRIMISVDSVTGTVSRLASKA